ncbi:plexin-A3-like [Ptychodera flava]|uniref:plexin-A3-like n=1 Tax=Ptychodera flava TaxID=63121 RepID=UPI003969BFC6
MKFFHNIIICQRFQLEHFQNIKIKSTASHGIFEQFEILLPIFVSRIQCDTSPSGSVKSGNVQITIGDTENQVAYTGTSLEDFSYVVSKIDGLTPQKGPQSGGTVVTISGENLNAGSVITATVAGFKCHITELSYDAITCVTSASDSSFPSGGVTVTFDGIAKDNTGAIYRYMADPVIEQLSRYEAFVSGGSKINVTGGNLDIVHTIVLRVFIKDKYYDGVSIYVMINLFKQYFKLSLKACRQANTSPS